MPFTAHQIAEHLGGEVVGDGSVVLTGLAPADSAGAGDLTFAENEIYLARAEQSAAGAVLVPQAFTTSRKTLIRVANPRVAFARVLPLFLPPERHPAGTHSSAVVAASAVVDPSAHIGPHCVVGERARIGARTALLGGNHVGAGAQIGDDTCLFANVVIYPQVQIGSRVRLHAGVVIGADGFGYVLDEGQHRKVPQIGNVIIQDDVEIGANSTIDRGALGSTVVGRGTKVDNLVMVGHNVVLGEHCLLVSQAGIAGSTRPGQLLRGGWAGGRGGPSQDRQQRDPGRSVRRDA